MKLAVVLSHPVQYYAPIFRELAARLDLQVFFAHRASRQDQARAGFGVGFEWDVDILSGYDHRFLDNVSANPGLEHFGGVDVPGIGAELEAGRYDGLLVMGWHLKAYVQAMQAARKLGIPVLVRGDSQLSTPRSMMKRAAKSLIYPLFLRRFAAALYVGERSRAYYRHYRYPEERLFFSPHCVDNDWFATRANEAARHALRAELGVADTTWLVLFAGKLVPFKRPLDVVEACGRLRRTGQDVQMVVAGSGELESALRQRARELDLPLHLLGFCNQSRMPAVYAAADVLVLSSSSETWGLVVNEALACGTPVVVSDACGCAPDLAEDRAVGRTYPVGDIQQLEQALAASIRSRPSTEQIARKMARYSPAHAAEGISVALAQVSKGC